MIRHRYRFLFIAVLLLSFPIQKGNANPNEQNACITCHTFLGGDLAKPALEWKGSIHQQNGIMCEDCHGGNPDVKLGNIKDLTDERRSAVQALAMSPADGFSGVPTGQDMFDMCAQCHSESVKRYKNSIMGKAYLENKGGPSCVTCHNAHNNSMPSVPKACESCHKNTEGFDQIDPMSVTKTTIITLSKIKIKIASEKTSGKPPLLAEFPEELGSFQIGFIAFGAILVLLIIAYLIYFVLERKK
ncbi:MAG: hypothetical protein GXO76_04440 [Calditrichaeota bacterium]|nr:hypothetical protein [Calditrichota bacterium]